MNAQMENNMTDQVSKIEAQAVNLRFADPMISMIEKAVMDPSFDIAKLETMLKLRAEHEEREDAKRAKEAERSFNRALAECQSEMPIVGRNRKNTHTNAKYTDLAGVLEAAGPIIARYGFAIQFNPVQSDKPDSIAVRWTLTHRDGHMRSDVGVYPIDAAGTGGKSNKTPIQAQASSRTYARRYLLIDLFNIATSDDADGNAPPAAAVKGITEAQYREINAQLDRTGTDENVMLKAAGVETVHDLSEQKAEGLLKTLRKKPEAGQ